MERPGYTRPFSFSDVEITMSISLTRDTLFKPVRPTAATRAEITNSTVRAINDADAEHREAKTARLRQARLQYEALHPVEKKPARVPKAKPSVSRRVQPTG